MRPGDSQLATCVSTGLAIPECSCAKCVEEMIRGVEPELLAAESAAIHELAAHSEVGAQGSIEDIDLAA